MNSGTIKICHFTSAHPADDVRIFHKECASLAAVGFQVFLVAANATEAIVKDVHIVSTEISASGRFSRMLKTSRAVYKKALSLDADIYHFHDPELLPYGLKLKRKGKQVIYDAHEDVPRQISGKEWIPKVIRGIIAFTFEKYENYVTKRLSAVVTSTPVIRNRFVQVNPETVAICNYPLLGEITKPAEWSERKNEICYVGGITVIRGIRELTASLTYLEGVRLNMAGAYETEQLKAEIKASPNYDRINDYGYIDRPGIVSILNRSRVGIVTLHPQSNYLESLPIKLFEYMLAGIPVVASDFPLWQSIIADSKCGLCVDPLDPKAIASAVQQILADDEAARKMGENGRLSVLEKYNWGIEEQELLKLYRKLLKLPGNSAD